MTKFGENPLPELDLDYKDLRSNPTQHIHYIDHPLEYILKEIIKNALVAQINWYEQEVENNSNNINFKVKF